MNYRIVKSVGIVLLSLWLSVTGFLAFILFALGFTLEGHGQNLLISVLIYLVGLGPVLWFIFLMKRHDEPIGYLGLSIFAVFAGSPVVLSVITAFGL